MFWTALTAEGEYRFAPASGPTIIPLAADVCDPGIERGPASLREAAQLKAETPVRSRPTISDWTESVPS